MATRQSPTTPDSLSPTLTDLTLSDGSTIHTPTLKQVHQQDAVSDAAPAVLADPEVVKAVAAYKKTLPEEDKLINAAAESRVKEIPMTRAYLKETENVIHALAKSLEHHGVKGALAEKLGISSNIPVKAFEENVMAQAWKQVTEQERLKAEAAVHPSKPDATPDARRTGGRNAPSL